MAAAAVAATLVVIGLPMVARDTIGDTPTRVPAPSNMATPTPANLLEVGDTVQFQAVDVDGPWADVTVTRAEQYDDPAPGSIGPDYATTDYYVEFEVTFEITRERSTRVSFAAQPDWTVFGETERRISPIRGLGWGEQHVPPLRNGPALERPVRAKAGDTVHGFIRTAISESYVTTRLAFTPRWDTTVDPRAVWPIELSWIIDD